MDGSTAAIGPHFRRLQATSRHCSRYSSSPTSGHGIRSGTLWRPPTGSTARICTSPGWSTCGQLPIFASLQGGGGDSAHADRYRCPAFNIHIQTNLAFPGHATITNLHSHCIASHPDRLIHGLLLSLFASALFASLPACVRQANIRPLRRSRSKLLLAWGKSIDVRSSSFATRRLRVARQIKRSVFLPHEATGCPPEASIADTTMQHLLSTAV
ncbi:hypothetical protein J3E68DRAFT_203222 [Trichoderma sp. SZMC 28012]